MLNTQLDLSNNNLLSSFPVLECLGAVQPAPPAGKPVRSIQESLNLLANTCLDLVTNMAKLQSQVDVMDAEK